MVLGFIVVETPRGAGFHCRGNPTWCWASLSRTPHVKWRPTRSGAVWWWWCGGGVVVVWWKVRCYVSWCWAAVVLHALGQQAAACVTVAVGHGDFCSSDPALRRRGGEGGTSIFTSLYRGPKHLFTQNSGESQFEEESIYKKALKNTKFPIQVDECR